MIIRITPESYIELNQFKETYKTVGKPARDYTEGDTLEYDTLCESLQNTHNSEISLCDNCMCNIAHRENSMFRNSLCDVCKEPY